MKALKVLIVLKAVIVIALLAGLHVPAFSERAATDILDDTYYKIHLSIYEAMPRKEGGVVFLGDSLTNYVPVSELFPGVNVINRGIAGDNTLGVLKRLDEVISLKPSKLFILLGTNDIVYNMTADTTAENLTAIIRRVQEGSPATKIYVETLLPTNPKFDTHRPNEVIRARNVKIKAVADETGCTLIDTHSHMAENGILPLGCTIDGIHLSGKGVVRWMEFLAPFVRE